MTVAIAVSLVVSPAGWTTASTWLASRMVRPLASRHAPCAGQVVKPAGKAGAITSSMKASHSGRSEEHTSELQSLMRISYAVFCLKKKKHHLIDTAHVRTYVIIHDQQQHRRHVLHPKTTNK